MYCLFPNFVPYTFFEPHLFFCLSAEFFSCSMIFLYPCLPFMKLIYLPSVTPGINNYLLTDTEILLLLIITLSFTEEQMIILK